MGRFDTTITLSGKIMHYNPNYLNPYMPTTAALIAMMATAMPSYYAGTPTTGIQVTEIDDYGNQMASWENLLPIKFMWKPHKGQILWDDYTLTLVENV